MRHKRHRFDPWVWKIPWSRKWQPTRVFLSGEFHGQRSLEGYSPWGRRESDIAERLTLSLSFTLSCLIVVVQLLSCIRLFTTPQTAAHQASLSTTKPRSLLKLMSFESVMPSYHLILCCPLLLLPSIFPSIRVFSNESVLCIRCPKYWSFNISPSNEYSGLISSRIDWLDLLAVKGTLESLLQHHTSKASLLQCSAFFVVQLSHPYMTTGKTIAL